MASIDTEIEDQRKLKAHIDRLSTSFASAQAQTKTKGYIETVMEDLEISFKVFKDGHAQIMEIVREASLREQDIPYLTSDVYYACYDAYIALKSSLIDAAYELETPRSPSVHASTFAASSSRNDTMCTDARLPKIELPVFSGDYLEWISYRDMFATLVHNTSLSNVKKFFYLKGSCTGTPLSIISEYPPCEDSYELAWNALEKRFHNERKLVEQILKKLFSIPPTNSSVHSVKDLLDVTRNCLAQLNTLKIDTRTWDCILIYITSQKLDIQTRKEWEQSLKASTKIPPMSDMLSFLETTFRTLESVEDDSYTHQINKSIPKSKGFVNDHPRKNIRSVRVHTGTTKQDDDCPCCQRRHPLYKCFRFSALSSAEKKKLIFEKRLCKNCLCPGHLQSSCGITARCQIANCKQPHHTIVHNEFCTPSSSSQITPNNAQSISNQNHSFTHPATTSTPETTTVSTHLINHRTSMFRPALLPTIKVIVVKGSTKYFIKALVDQGSQLSFVSENLVQLLELPKYKTHVTVSGIGGHSSLSVKKYTELQIYSAYKPEFELPFSALIVPTVTTYMPNSSSKIHISDLPNVFLADKNFMEAEKIDLLLGNNVYCDLLLSNQIKCQNGLLLQETYFGWMISGNCGPKTPKINISTHLCSLDDQLRLFWEQEELLDGKQQIEEDILCEKLFAESHTRDNSGRYSIHLPFKKLLHGHDLPVFTHTDYNALRRLKQLESCFETKPIFAEEYKKFMREYEQLNHMVNLGEYPKAIPKNAFFFPHHGVLRESTTTKLRVVFDGSNRRAPQPSLNEELSSGPALQNDLPNIINRWRRHYIGFTSDLEKMFRQINVCSEHRSFQCILWRNEDTKKICVYSLNTVTYGTTSAPYLAIRVLQQLAADEATRFANASKILLSDTYVDDVISGADSVPEAIEMQKQLSSLLKSGGFHLRKWNSNSKGLLNTISECDRESTDSYYIQQQNMSKALGISWDTTNDSFCFSINFIFSNPVTKSSLLSDASKLFDPLGWLAPTTILAKIIFQKLWKTDLDWNDLLPLKLQNEWIQFRDNLKTLEEIRIPRWIGYTKGKSVDLHAFSDASQLAYSAVVYTVIKTDSGEVRTNILQSKTKVAPLKTQTIPRLELSAAALLVKLVAKIKSDIDYNIGRVVYWTDSTIVLAWLKNKSSKLEVFVANRVSVIQNLSNVNDWHYVPSSENPADCASRGLNPKDLVHHKLWWHGPQFLKKSPDTWPVLKTETLLSTEETSCNISTINSLKSYPDIPFHKIIFKFSKLSTVIRVTSYILRFCSFFKTKSLEKGFLKTYELNRALNILIKITQAATFQSEINFIKNKTSLPKHSKIVKLSPFLDEFGILRVGGRLSNSQLPYQTKHPILLTKNNPLSLLIFSEAHIKTFHGSIQLMQSYVLQQYWIISARDLAKAVQRKCIVCFKYKAEACKQLMGNLPAVRLQSTRPFKHSGLDYAGPINIKTSMLRNAKTIKGYICLFVCMCTKAIHLEAVTSLNVDSFLAAFRRFISRRGMCTDIYSDCGTNFVGASKELQILYQRNKASLPEYLVESLANQGTNWHFIPPASPHFGGLWEAGVKSTKYHLKRIMKDKVLTYEELSTLLSQIESCLNSRPLCPISTDPADSDALTPAHFLIGEPSTCLPEEDLLDTNIDRLNRWKLIEHLKQKFWLRWKQEYVCRLQARPKWNNIERNLEVGDLVLLQHEKCIPGQWPLARVAELHPGIDGLVRVVTLYCNGKNLKRPISKLCRLPIDNPNQETNIETSSN